MSSPDLLVRCLSSWWIDALAGDLVTLLALYAGNTPVTTVRASKVEDELMSWRYHMVYIFPMGGDVMSVHYNDVIIGTMASQITSLMFVYSAVYSSADQRKHQSSASLAFVQGILPVTGEFPAQKANKEENVSIWWRHHEPSEEDVTNFSVMGCHSLRISAKIFKNFIENFIEKCGSGRWFLVSNNLRFFNEEHAQLMWKPLVNINWAITKLFLADIMHVYNHKLYVSGIYIMIWSLTQYSDSMFYIP